MTEVSLPGASNLTSEEAKAALSSLRQMAGVVRTRGGDSIESNEATKRLMGDAQAFVEAATDPGQFDTVYVAQLWAQAGLREKMGQALQSTAKIASPGEKVVAQAAVATFFQHLVMDDPYWRRTYDQPGGWKQLRDSILGKIPQEKREEYLQSRLHTMRPTEFQHEAWEGITTGLIEQFGEEEHDKWKEFIFAIT